MDEGLAQVRPEFLPVTSHNLPERGLPVKEAQDVGPARVRGDPVRPVAVEGDDDLAPLLEGESRGVQDGLFIECDTHLFTLLTR